MSDKPTPEYLATLTANTQRYFAELEAENAELSRGGIHWWHEMRKVAKALGVPRLSGVCGEVERLRKYVSEQPCEQTKCPKCGADARTPTVAERDYCQFVVAWTCGSRRYTSGAFVQAQTCRIAELEAENDRLRGDVECYEGMKEGVAIRIADLERQLAEARGAGRYIATCLGGAAAKGGWTREEIGRLAQYVRQRWPWADATKPREAAEAAERTP